ncbi:MAG: ABC transporter ATP-binding protein [Bacillota bacterium]
MIKVNNLSFKYNNAKEKAIKSIDFSIKEGEIFGFLGPSGAGKTTTQKLLIGLLRHYSGNIKIFGKERSEFKNDYFEKIGVAFETPNMYLKLTAKENLELIQSYYQNDNENINNLLKKVGLFKDKDKIVAEFSKGMKMRLNFIRALLHSPKLIFLDEPTSGLDPANARVVKEMIKKLKNENKTIFLTTHDMTVASQLCDKIALIDNGEIQVIDTPKNLMIKHGKSSVNIEYYSNNNLVEKSFNLDNLKNNNEFLNIINNHSIKTMHSQEATLEDVFIKLTGRSL